MITAKHTPGPWTAHDRLADQGAVVIENADGLEVLSTFTCAIESDAEELANGILAAAAPDLLAALEMMMVGVPEHVTSGEIKAARAAIAKARGGA